MSQPSAQLLERLQGVRATGYGRWIARCPAHDDKRPSLSIREGDTGAVLVYCWGGCTLSEIAAAAGLNVADLFPPRETNTDQGSKWKPWRRTLANSLSPLVVRYQADLILVHLFLSDIAAGQSISPLDRETARAAAARVWNALHEAQHAVA